MRLLLRSKSACATIQKFYRTDQVRCAIPAWIIDPPGSSHAGEKIRPGHSLWIGSIQLWRIRHRVGSRSPSAFACCVLDPTDSHGQRQGEHEIHDRHRAKYLYRSEARHRKAIADVHQLRECQD
jgi:hypothetical protein